MKRYLKKIFIACLVLLTLIGCDSKESELKASNNLEKKEQLVFVNYRDIRDLNPHLYAGEMYAQEMLYETLVNIGPNGYEPCLAESWNISDDGKIYTFNIRKNVKFSDGTICDANAIKANFDAILENKNRHTWLEMMHLLEGVDLIDDYTIQIKLSKSYYPMLTELAVTRPFAMISPKAMKNGSTKDGVNAYIGTGSYILKEFVTDEYAVFEANENYWGKIPEIKKILVKVIPDNQTRILALEKGEIDLIFGKNMIDADAVNKYKNNGKFTVALSDATSTRQIVINTTNKILKDKNVRYALQHATNKEAISHLYDVKNSFNSYPIDYITQQIGLVSVLNSQDMKEKCQKVIQTREYTKTKLKELGFVVPDSYANFVFVKHPKIDGEELFLALRKEGIIVRHWNKPLIDQYLRVTIGTDQQMERFFEFLENYLNQKELL